MQVGEVCDNGKYLGCSTCLKIDKGFTLNDEGQYISKCGDGIRTANELCDNKEGPGCRTGCFKDLAYQCTQDSTGFSQCNSKCGDGFVAEDEVCDLLKFDEQGVAVDQIGCDPNCKAPLPGYQCSPGQPIKYPNYAEVLKSSYLQLMAQKNTIQDYNLL